MEKIKKNNKGFTLVELIVVIAILGVLAAVLVPQYTQYIERSRQKTDLSTLGEVLHAAETAAAVTGATGTITVTDTAGVLTFASGSIGASVVSDMTDICGGAKLQSSTASSYTGGTITIASGSSSWDSTTEGLIANLSA